MSRAVTVKDIYIKKLRSRMMEWQERIDTWEKELGASKEDGRQEHQVEKAHIAELTRQQEIARSIINFIEH